MHITQEADYAVRIVYCLAREARRMDARTISEQMAISLRFSLKILGKLAQSGLVVSYKGNRGGRWKARTGFPAVWARMQASAAGGLPGAAPSSGCSAASAAPSTGSWRP